MDENLQKNCQLKLDSNFSPLLGLEKNIQYVIVIITEETGGYSKWLKSDTVQNSLNR